MLAEVIYRMSQNIHWSILVARQRFVVLEAHLSVPRLANIPHRRSYEHHVVLKRAEYWGVR